jgi:multidrug transporter EmrE-like cation transporter
MKVIDKWINSINWNYNHFNMLPVFFGVLMAIVDICMMSSSKLISNGSMSTVWGIPLIMGLYSLQPLIFLKALNYEGMISTNLIWNLTSNILVTLQGSFVFGESIKGLKWVAILMSLFSISLMAYTD